MRVDVVAGPESEGVERGDGDLGGERQFAVDADADAVAEPVDVGDRAAPGVARRSMPSTADERATIECGRIIANDGPAMASAITTRGA